MRTSAVPLTSALAASVAAALALALAGCPSDEPMTVPPPPPPMINLATLCTEIAKADCERLERCGLRAAPFDDDACTLRQEKIRCEPFRAAAERAVGTGELSFFELAATACRDEIASLECTIGPDVQYFDVPECGAVLGGNAADGASCNFSFSCAGGSFCAVTQDCPGRCQTLRGNNETCSSSEPCVEGFFCATPAMRCRASVALDAPCELSVAGNSCSGSAFCDGSQPGGARCAPARGRGTGCRSSFECASGLRCINSLCSGGQQGDSCIRQSDCGGVLHCSGNRCVTPLVAGEECTDNASCKEGLACTSSAAVMMDFCSVRAALGESCSDNKLCYLSRCDRPGMPPPATGTCVALKADGESCADAEECFPGRACTDNRCAVDVVFCGP